ncbi:MAG TPA: malto-oligosyltrehalose synthase, partial [Streptosporangiaceae bacterium]|nr:malto-oligosyltrehalose synthase [Streptosporangiaceae bacterium]
GDGRMLLPVLGAPPDKVANDLREADGTLRYFDHVFPLRPGTEGLPLSELLDAQHYELADWRDASTRLNYRRFFDISTLIGISQEERDVFDETHQVLLRLYRDGLIDGFRIDHPDGLADPRGYLRELRAATDGAWVVVEKILARDEELPGDWPCAGTTGYDALALVDRLFTDPAGAAPLDRAYADMIGRPPPEFAEVAYQAKHEMATEAFAAEVSRLLRLLPPDRRDREALIDRIAASRVYRTYELTDEFTIRYQQTTGPVVAKGVEDTAGYRWHRLVSLNEVGGDPDQLAVAPEEFHAAMAHRAATWPATMTTLSTHDTKRQEDVRARLAVLSEIPDEWAAQVADWRATMGGQLDGIDRETEYLIWQTLAGAWPIGGDRLGEYLTKAVREAKLRTSWTDPDEYYEQTVRRFADAMLAKGGPAEQIAHFVMRISADARVNSLGVKLVQLTMPGVPDVYQGCELGAFALTDPDNRRQVDFGRRRELLAAGAADGLDAEKLLVTSRALRLRRDHPDWFAAGYTPLAADGPRAAHAVAFARGGAVTAATRLPVGLRRAGGWGGTTLDPGAGAWRDLLTGTAYRTPILMADLLSSFPVALLVRV